MKNKYDADNPMPPELIRERNDKIRKNLLFSSNEFGIKMMITEPVLSSPFRDEILRAIRDFDSFNDEGNDPYGEHDFGFVTVQDEKYCFKFGYYDNEFINFGYENFVMTIMHASEY